MPVPTRRTLLAGLAALPVASIPALAATGPDTALIAFAAEVEALAIRSNEAIAISCDLESECERLVPIRSQPKQPDSVDAFETTIERFPNGGSVLRQMPIVPDPAAVLAAERQTAAVEAWQVRREEAAHSVGLEAANDLSSAIYAQLEAAVIELTSMQPATLAGLAAKARVAVLLDPHDDFSLNDWECALRAAVLQDVARIGGAA